MDNDKIDCVICSKFKDKLPEWLQEQHKEETEFLYSISFINKELINKDTKDKND